MMHISRPSWLPARITPQMAGAYVVWAASVLASMSALYGLAVSYGGWNKLVAVLFPLTLDLYWITALGVALDSALTVRRRMAALAHGLAAISASVGGNLLYHELQAGDIHLVHPWKALTVAAISSVPLLAGTALTHLVALSRPVTVPARPKRIVPAKAANRAKPDADHAKPDNTTVPDHAANPDETTKPSDPAGPRQLKPGGRPDPIAIQAARDEWHAAVKGGQIHNDRSLEKAVNDRYGYKVIGRTSAGSVIAEETDARRRAV